MHEPDLRDGNQYMLQNKTSGETGDRENWHSAKVLGSY
jgi:hypothetical protein